MFNWIKLLLSVCRRKKVTNYIKLLLWISYEQRMKWIYFVNRITMCNFEASSHVPPPPPPPSILPLNRPVSKYHNTLCCPPPKFCINIVFSFSWELQSPQEKLKTILMRKRALWYWKNLYEIGYFRVSPCLCIKTRLSAWPMTGQTRTFLVALSVARSSCGLEISFVVRGAGAVMLLFRFYYKTSVVIIM